jgi:hypothetical protein
MVTMPRLPVLWVSASIAASIASGQTIYFTAVSRQIVEQRLGAYVTENDKRESAVRRLFEDAGCAGEKLTERPAKGLKAPNLTCSLTGETERVIVVGAHFDLVENGDGVVDNWTGASLLPSLYQIDFRNANAVGPPQIGYPRREGRSEERLRARCRRASEACKEPVVRGI